MKKITKRIVFIALVVCMTLTPYFSGEIQAEEFEEDYQNIIYHFDEINDKWISEYNNEVVFTEDELQVLEQYKGDKLKVAIAKENAMINEFDGNIVGEAYYALLQLEKDLGIDFEIDIVDAETLAAERENYDIISSFNTTVFDDIKNEEAAEEEIPNFYASKLYSTMLYEVYSRDEKQEQVDISEVLNGDTGVYSSINEKKVIETKNEEDQYYPNLVYEYSVENLINNQKLDYFILPKNSIALSEGLNKINDGFETYSMSNKILVNEKLGKEFLDIVNKTITEVKEENLTNYSESLELSKCADGYYFTEAEKMFIESTPALLTEYLTDGYPFVFYDEKNGEVSGQLVDVLKRVSAVTGLNFKNVEADSDISKIMEDLSNKEIDLGVGFGLDFNRTKFAYSADVDISDNFILMGYDGISTPVNIYEYKLGVVDKSLGHNYAEMMYPAKELYVYPTIEEAYVALKNGEIDLLSNTEDQYYFFVNSYGDYDLKIIEEVDVDSDSLLLTSHTEDGKLLASIISKTAAHIDLDEIKNKDYPLANRDTLSSFKSDSFLQIGFIIISIMTIFLLYLIYQFRKTRKTNKTLKDLNTTVNNAIKVTKFAMLQYNTRNNFIMVENQYLESMSFFEEDLITIDDKKGIDFQVISNKYLTELSYEIDKIEVHVSDFSTVFQEIQDRDEFKLKVGVKRFKNKEDIAYFEILCKKNKLNKDVIDMVMRDTTSDVLYNKYLALNVDKDSLTNCLNRKAMFELDLKKYENKTLLFISFNNLQQVNNSFSCATGDKVLIEFVTYVKGKKYVEEIYRPENTKFLLILDEFNEDIAEDLTSYVSRVITAGNVEVQLTGIFSVLMLNDHNFNSMDTILNIMSSAIKNEIAKGRDYCIIDDKMFNKYNTMNNLDSLLREAIVNDEIVPFFQPYTDIHTMKVVGYETLMRWIHKDEMIMPNILLPIAIKNGLIYDIDVIIFRKSVEFLRSLQDDGLVDNDFSASSNFTPITLSKVQVEDLMNIVTVAGVSPGNITIEITEQLFSNDEAFIKIRDLKNAGFKIAIDDFSVGHSSMSYLKRLNADVLKLDKSLLDGTHEKMNLEIYKTVVNLGLSLNAKIISEGVETQEELKVLDKAKVKIAQGYFFSRPINRTSMLEYIQSKNKR